MAVLAVRVIIRDVLAASHCSVPGRQIVGHIHDINGPLLPAGHHPLLSGTFSCSILNCLRDLQARRRVNASVARNGFEVEHKPYRWVLRKTYNRVSLFLSSEIS